MPLKTLGLACAVVVLSSPLASAQVNFDELFSTLAYNDESPPAVPAEVLPQLPADPPEIGAAPVDDHAPLTDAFPIADSAPDSGPAPTPQASAHRIDFPALLSDCDASPTHPHFPAPHHLAGHPHAASCGGSCPRHPMAGCESCRTDSRPTPCLEHPNLPPPTSLEASYRTPACYRDLWGGYHHQRQQECRSHHKHLHGHCKCLGKPAIEPVGLRLPPGHK